MSDQKASDPPENSERLALFARLAGGVGHELRNPLGVMKNSIYYLRLVGKDMTPKVKEHLEILDNQVFIATQIVEELLDFGWGAPSNKNREDLRGVLAAALKLVRIPEGIDIRHSVDDSPLMVDVDAGQVRRLLVNLIRNAVQAMPEGGAVDLSCQRESGFAVASVADSGAGIEPDKIEKIFEPLYTERARGIGLGLTLARRYARNNDGTLHCRSIPGEGAAFELRLPLLTEEGDSFG